MWMCVVVVGEGEGGGGGTPCMGPGGNKHLHATSTFASTTAGRVGANGKAAPSPSSHHQTNVEIRAHVVHTQYLWHGDQQAGGGQGRCRHRCALTDLARACRPSRAKRDIPGLIKRLLHRSGMLTTPSGCSDHRQCSPRVARLCRPAGARATAAPHPPPTFGSQGRQGRAKGQHRAHGDHGGQGHQLLLPAGPTLQVLGRQGGGVPGGLRLQARGPSLLSQRPGA